VAQGTRAYAEGGSEKVEDEERIRQGRCQKQSSMAWDYAVTAWGGRGEANGKSTKKKRGSSRIWG